MKWFTNLFFKVKEDIKEESVREKLKILYVIFTDKATYIAYNTQTVQGKDCVNIQIEELQNDTIKIILQDKIFDDSFGAMGGEAFNSLVSNSMYHLKKYIKDKNESIIQTIEIK